MSITVRPITSEDFAAVTRLLEILGRPTVDETSQAAARRVFQEHVDNPDNASLLAEFDGEPVGFISLVIRPRLNWTTPQAWVPDLIVAEAMRGQGVGHALLTRAIEIARQRNCHELTLESGFSRTVAHAFYEAHNMENHGYYFVISLEDNE